MKGGSTRHLASMARRSLTTPAARAGTATLWLRRSTPRAGPLAAAIVTHALGLQAVGVERVLGWYESIEASGEVQPTAAELARKNMLWGWALFGLTSMGPRPMFANPAVKRSRRCPSS